MDKSLEVIRVGTKVISRQKIDRAIDDIISLRSKGLSQQEVARRLDLERTFISRIETLGEIRKGRRIALLGFPVANKEELIETCRELGIEYVWVMNNTERWELIRDKKALDFFNLIVEVIAELKKFELLIMLTTERWFKVAEAFLDIQVVLLELGKSPITKDCHFDVNYLVDAVREFSPEQKA